MKSVRNIAILLIVTITIIAVLIFLRSHIFSPRHLRTQVTLPPEEVALTKVKIGNSDLYTEKALNEDAWSQGLSGRKELKKDTGMMFIFPTAEIKNFWMKDTIIPLDIIWVAENKVVGIDRMFPELNTPLPLLKRYISPSPVNIVIETNLGWTSEHQIKIGDKISY